jgi:hypothetical protein
MDEKKTSGKFFENRIPEDVREHARAARGHVRAARDEWRESAKALLPRQFREHTLRAGKEMLLAWRSLIDAAIERMDEKKD